MILFSLQNPNMNALAKYMITFLVLSLFTTAMGAEPGSFAESGGHVLDRHKPMDESCNGERADCTATCKLQNCATGYCVFATQYAAICRCNSRLN